MKKRVLFIDCFMGISGDMLLASLLDVGVPFEFVKQELKFFGMGEKFNLEVKKTSSYGFTGNRILIDILEKDPPHKSFSEIRDIILDSHLGKNVKKRSLDVFETIAEVESSIHGCSIDQIHFHEIGALDSLIDIIGVCVAIEYLNPSEIICKNPPSGSGFVETSHGVLPVPVPAVLEISRRKNIKLVNCSKYHDGELTTPTGIALIANLADKFGTPEELDVESIGIGLGKNDFKRPNFLRICSLRKEEYLNQKFYDGYYWEEIKSQEAWIDDITPEDLSELISNLREGGAIDVICHSVQMKKSRNGFRLVAISTPHIASKLRSVWFSKGITIGLRERDEGRWVLPRRKVVLETFFGKVLAKEVVMPDGEVSIKIEHDEIVRISLDTGKSLDSIRKIIINSTKEFKLLK